MNRHKGYYFLASPFNGSPEEKKEGYGASKKIAAFFLERGISLFAPILYNESIIDFFSGIQQNQRRSLLMPMTENFLCNSQGMILLNLEGWDISWGIQHYFQVCKENKVSIYALIPHDPEPQLATLTQSLSTLLKNPPLCLKIALDAITAT